MSRRNASLNRSELLRDSDRQTTSMSLPLAIHYKLGRLSELAASAKASRADVIATLIAEAELDSASLARRVMAYRETTVGEIVEPLDPQHEGSDSVVVPMGRPGRPRIRRQP